MKNIVFDIGNVLVDWNWKRYMRTLFSDEETIKVMEDAYWKNELWREMDRGALSQETIHRELLNSAKGYEEQMELSYQRLGECISGFTYTKPLINELHERGFKVYYLSNYSDYLIEKNPQALDFTAMMDGGIFSCHVKLIKPDLAIYDKLCKTYSLEPSECFFIDDKLINIIAAKEYGMDGMQFTDYDTVKARLDLLTP